MIINDKKTEVLGEVVMEYSKIYHNICLVGLETSIQNIRPGYKT
jgi:hypothetical protein